MSVAFVPPQKGRPSPSPAQIQKMLDENSQLIQGIVDYQNKGKAAECLQYQQILHRNLVYLASIADTVPSPLPPPPSHVGATTQPLSTSEPSQIPSPSPNQGGVIQQTHSTVQVNSPTASRGVATSVAPSAAPSGGITQNSGVSPNTSYGMATQPTQSQQAAAAAANHLPSTQPVQSMPQSSQGSSHVSQNVGNYSRSVTPQQYGSMHTGAQQYGSSPYSSGQNQSHPYGSTVTSQNSFSSQNASSNFTSEGSPNYQASAPQQGFSSSTTSTTQQQQAVSSQQQHSTQDYPNSTLPQTTTYSAPTVTTSSQAHTAQSSQAYVTQSYGASSNSSSQWYQTANSQPCSSSSSQSTYPSASVSQGYSTAMNHSVGFQSQSAAPNYGSPPATAPSQAGFAHHSPSSTPQESPPPSAPSQQNRFPSNFSGYVHYRSSSQAPSHAVMGGPMGPPSSGVHRPPVSSSASQNQGYSYEQSQGYPSYQSQ